MSDEPYAPSHNTLRGNLDFWSAILARSGNDRLEMFDDRMFEILGQDIEALKRFMDSHQPTPAPGPHPNGSALKLVAAK